MISRIYVGSAQGRLEELGWLADPRSDFQSRARRAAAVLAFHAVDGATIIPSVGVWRGEVEQSMVVEIIGTGPIEPLADALRAEFGQDAVLVSTHSGTSFLVERAP